MKRLPSIGVTFPASAAVEGLPAFSVRAEMLGFDEVWVVEDCFFSGGLVMAATALAATKELHVGLGLMPAAIRNPALAAMEIGALAWLHPGRFTAVFGHGVSSWMHQIGAAPSRRLAALGEVTSVVRALLAGETVTLAGDHVTLAGVTLERPPDIVPQILIGSTGPKGLALAGRSADGFLVAEGCGPTFVAWAKRQAYDAQQAPAHEPHSAAYAWLRIDDDEDEARSVLRPAVDQWLASGLYPEPARACGIELPLPPGAVPAGLAKEIAVVGDRMTCARAVRRYAEAGAHRLVLVAVGPEPDQQYGRFASEVLPLL